MKIKTVIAHGLALTGSLVVLAACGGTGAGYVVDNPKPPPPKVEPEVATTPDAFRDHRGERVKVGSKFRLSAKPIAVEGAEFVIALLKVDWSTMTAPSGKEIKEGTAQLTITKGEESASALVAQGDFKRAFGYRVGAVAAGEEYNKQRMTYDPWVELIVTAEE